MNRVTTLLAAIAVCATCSLLLADYGVSETGDWPKTWPAELEPLRKQARTLEGPMVPQLHYEIPFAKRAEFEAAWPHLLKVKDKGAPIILLRGPHAWLGTTTKAGVRVHSPPAHRGARRAADPAPGAADARERAMWTTYIEVIADGDVVDLNRIPLPADAPIVDERFKEGAGK
jgi:hypothetical protein